MFVCFEVEQRRLHTRILTELGLTNKQMVDDEGFVDALFFYQLLLPICDTTKNDNDPRMSFYISYGSNALQCIC
jgi:hypothetical protein